MATINGFQTDFIAPNNSKLRVALPALSDGIKDDLLKITGARNGELKYVHYSACLSKKRKFCFFSAANVDGANFVQVTRKSLFPPSGTDKWVPDALATTFQWGSELYSAKKSDFDKGHMTRREDPQWGTTEKQARDGALATFHFTNAVPQHSSLNRKIWGNLEDYVLHTEAEPNKLRINVITGPVLSADDPFFVTLIKEEQLQLPVLFWKIIYYTNDGKNLSRAGFMMGQRDLLIKEGTAKPGATRAFIHTKAPQFFQDYEDKAIFQVNIATIEKLTGLVFHPASEPFTDKRPIKLIVDEIQAKGLRAIAIPLKVSFKNIKLS